MQTNWVRAFESNNGVFEMEIEVSEIGISRKRRGAVAGNVHIATLRSVEMQKAEGAILAILPVSRRLAELLAGEGGAGAVDALLRRRLIDERECSLTGTLMLVDRRPAPRVQIGRPKSADQKAKMAALFAGGGNA